VSASRKINNLRVLIPTDFICWSQCRALRGLMAQPSAEAWGEAHKPRNLAKSVTVE